MQSVSEQNDKKALEFLSKHKTGVIASVTTDGVPHAATVYFTAGDDFSIYFLTKTSTKKYKIFTENGVIAFVVSSEEEPQTVQLQGVVKEVAREDQSMRIMERLLHNVTSNPLYTAPLSKLEDAKVVLMKITPHWLRWSDFTLGTSNPDTIFFEKYVNIE